MTLLQTVVAINARSVPMNEAGLRMLLLSGMDEKAAVEWSAAEIARRGLRVDAASESVSHGR